MDKRLTDAFRAANAALYDLQVALRHDPTTCFSNLTDKVYSAERVVDDIRQEVVQMERDIVNRNRKD